MIQKYISIITLSLITCIVYSCLGMEPVVMPKPKTINSRTQSKYIYEDPTTRATERSLNAYGFRTENRFIPIPESVKVEQTKKINEQHIPLKSKAIQAIKPPMAQELYVQENATAQSEHNKIAPEQKTTLPSISQELYLVEQKIESQPEINSKSNPETINPNEKALLYSEAISPEKFNPSGDQNIAKDMNHYIPQPVISKLEIRMKKALFTMLKKTLHVSSARYIVKLSFAAIIAEYLQEIIFDFSNLPHSIDSLQDNSYNSFRMQVQYLAEQIKKYNNNTTYTSPDQMLLLIECINQFLKENNIIFFSQAMFTKLNDVVAIAKNCCDIIRNKNIILTSTKTPQSVMLLFQPVIENTNNLSNITYSHNIMHAIYDTNGYMDNIIQTWINFKSSDLNKITINNESTAMNNQYAAFLTFLLLFENSIVAAAIIIDETSALYKVTNPIPVIINIA